MSPGKHHAFRLLWREMNLPEKGVVWAVKCQTANDPNRKLGRQLEYAIATQYCGDLTVKDVAQWLGADCSCAMRVAPDVIVA